MYFQSLGSHQELSSVDLTMGKALVGAQKGSEAGRA